MITGIGDGYYSTSLTERDDQFADDVSSESALADSLEDDLSRYEQVIHELTEFENAQGQAGEEEAILEKANS